MQVITHGQPPARHRAAACVTASGLTGRDCARRDAPTRTGPRSRPAQRPAPMLGTGSGASRTARQVVVGCGVSGVSAVPLWSQAVPGVLATELRSRAAWDEPPCLYTVHMRSGTCRLRPLRVSADTWSGRPLGESLKEVDWILRRLTSRPGYRSPADLYGAAFRWEEQSAPSQSLGSAAAGPSATAWDIRGVQAGTGDTGVRSMIARDWAGFVYEARQWRGERAVHTGIYEDPAGCRQSAGIVQATLGGIVTSLTGIGSQRDAGPEAEL